MYMLPVAVAWSFSDDNAIYYGLPVLWMTSWGSRRCVWTSSPCGGTVGDLLVTGAKSAVLDCFVLLQTFELYFRFELFYTLVLVTVNLN